MKPLSALCNSIDKQVTIICKDGTTCGGKIAEVDEFQNLIMDLRETKVSAYVKADTPMIVCVKKDLIPMIKSLGES